MRLPIAAILAVPALASLAWLSFAQGSGSSEPVPPYYESEAAAKPFPKTLPPQTFPHPLLQKVYKIAMEIPGVLAQQPCYCHCNRMGHKGLLACHVDTHSAG